VNKARTGSTPFPKTNAPGSGNGPPNIAVTSARAVLTKRHVKLLALVDQMAQQRLLVWPEQKAPPHA
jgi:hypothetical protein